MKINCPKDIGYENIFIGEECHSSDCFYHCWTSSIAKHDQDITENIIKNILNNHGEEPRLQILKNLASDKL